MPPQTQATTILAFKFAEGVLVAGDRRATAGNIVVYDRADKVLEIDRHSVMAIAGVPATAWEMARVLEHSFQYYRRTQLQEMSVGGKVRALSKLLRDNFGLVMQGVGVVVPLFATHDTRPGRRGEAVFLRRDGRELRGGRICRHGFGLAGRARCAVLREHLGPKPLREFSREEALRLTSCARSTPPPRPTPPRAAWTATAVSSRWSRSSPRDGIQTVTDDTLRDLFNSGRHPSAQPLSAGVPIG